MSGGHQQPLRPGRTASGRLPSLRPIRDLTLGGGTTPVSPISAAAAAARTGGSNPSSSSSGGSTRAKFTPNLTAAGRRQTPSVPAPTEQEAGASGPPKRGRPDGGGRGRGGGGSRGQGRGGRGGGRGRGGGGRYYEPEIIQSKGIFSDGLAETTGTGRTGRNEDFLQDGGVASSRTFREKRDRSKLSKGDDDALKSEALETDEQALKHLLRDDFLATSLNYDRIPPISLPLRSSADAAASSRIIDFPAEPMEVDQKPDVSTLVTEEKKPPDVLLSASSSAQLISAIPVGSLPPSFEEIFRHIDDKSDQGRLFFVQLPNILSHTLVTRRDATSTSAVANGSIKRELTETDQQHQTQTAIKSEPTDHQHSSESPPTSEHDETSVPGRKSGTGNHTLDAIPGGRIGKLQLMKSGRVRLKLNEATDNQQRQQQKQESLIFDVVPGAKTSFLQQVVVINTSRDGGEETGRLYVLGDVQHRLLCTPKIDNLLMNMKKLPH